MSFISIDSIEWKRVVRVGAVGAIAAILYYYVEKDLKAWIGA